MSPSQLKLRVSLLVVGALLLAGCAQERLREESQLQMREGKFESAVQLLEGGITAYPDSALLRSGLLQARNEAFARLLTEAAGLRASGKLDEAEAVLKRAAAFDGTGKRVTALLQDVAVERRQREALAEANALVQSGQTAAALRVLATALKDNARQPDLVALQRRLESEQRRTQLRAAQQGLAEVRPIALDFRDANLRTVLDVVTRHSGINFILDKDVRSDIRVTVLLRSVRVEDAIDLIVSTHQLAKKVVDAQTVLIYPNTPDKQREHQEQVVRVFHLASAEAKGAAAFLRSMLRIRDPYVDERSNMLAIRESPENIELAERLIALYDTNEPEVLLELEVIEVRSSRLTDLGIKFPDSVGLTPLSSSGSTGLTVSDLRGINSDRIGVSVAGLLLNLKREVGEFNTLANPRIRARNKEKAKVLIGDKVPVITTTTSQGGFVGDSVAYIEVGLKLDVEPTVYADDEVAIRVALEVSSLTREVRTSSGSLAYQIGTRTASTLLRLRDGETQLLAGLISNDERSSSSRVPGLGDLPVAGRLFSQQHDESQRTELVLAITPRVLRNVRKLEASESELWVGTETAPRMRAVGGLLAAAPGASAPAAGQPMTPGAGAALVPSGPGRGPADVPPARAPTRASLRWKAPAEVAVGETFVATLELESTAAMRGIPVQLRFPPAKLQIVGIEEGEFFRAQGAPTSFTQGIEAQAGIARAGVIRNQATTAQGKGEVLRVRMKALAAGSAEVLVVGADPVMLGERPPAVELPPALRVVIK